MSGATGGSKRRLGVATALVVALTVGAAAPTVLASPPAPEPASEPASQPAPQPEPDPEVGVGEVDGTTVAVGAPPVPPAPVPTTVVVAVGQPPVPPKVAPIKPASVANRPVQRVEPPQAKVSAAAHQVTAGLAVLTELL
jgi:hypothetical protein